MAEERSGLGPKPIHEHRALLADDVSFDFLFLMGNPLLRYLLSLLLDVVMGNACRCVVCAA